MLTAHWPVGKGKNNSVYLLCLCHCGNLKIVRGDHLRSGRIKSCGCFRNFGEAHGHSGNGRGRLPSPTYYSWRRMIDRCTSQRNENWKYYGAQGVQIHENWMKFSNFLADMGERPPSTTLGRIGDSGNYEPGNCRWMTQKDQVLNRKRKIA